MRVWVHHHRHRRYYSFLHIAAMQATLHTYDSLFNTSIFFQYIWLTNMYLLVGLRLKSGPKWKIFWIAIASAEWKVYRVSPADHRTSPGKSFEFFQLQTGQTFGCPVQLPCFSFILRNTIDCFVQSARSSDTIWSSCKSKSAREVDVAMRCRWRYDGDTGEYLFSKFCSLFPEHWYWRVFFF